MRPLSPPVRLGAAGRFLVPYDRGVLGYYVRRLRVAHGPRERVLGGLAACAGERLASTPWVGTSLAGRLLLSGRWAFDPARWELLAGPEAKARGKTRYEAASAADLPPADLPPADLLPADLLPAAELRPAAGLLRALAGLPLEVRETAGMTGRWRPILLFDYAGSARRQLLVFPFRPGATSPTTVVKVGPLNSGDLHLRAEYDALRGLRDGLPRPLASTLPEPLAYYAGPATEPAAEVLVLEHLNGPSAYNRQQNALRPTRAAEEHFRAAADWLAAFHRTTQHGRGRYTPGPEEESLVPLAGEGGGAWYGRLRDLAERHPLPLSAGHGDFWARNLLLAPDGAQVAGVVDWEHACPETQPLADLLLFPLVYGQNHPWARYRRLPRPEAFRRTFFDDTPIARTVRTYLARYAHRAGLTLPPLGPFIRLLLLRQAAQSAGEEQAGWLACDRLLAAAPSDLLSSLRDRP